ncbi:hypothetical protein [Mycobacterium paraterrae]|uniref:PE-PGRS family protein n=1 Tax=Mycobacterium paraterrae TaxID=577492 RepID=A0ABY3VPG1_9MYCO|nr:hypothetical protein [Mycobacterium paraterrae]UMB71307.1 hypothetical protein MKK62_08700 [Mycobacterium paraterrae]
MDIRKIAAAAGFATGTALTFAPLATADTPITSTVDSEISSLNSIFDGEAALAGNSADITHHAGSFDTILPADAPQTGTPTLLDYELYGVNPIAAGPASDPGSYNVFNGALGKFDDAYNVYLYAAQNNGAMDMNDADFIGSPSSIDYAQTLGVTGAEQYYLNFALGDLEGYFGIFPQSAASTAEVDPLASVVTSEVSAMNSLFVSEATLAGIPSADYSAGPQGFDVINPADIANDAPASGTPSILDYELFGVQPFTAGVASDPGAFSEFNGALVNFDDALNVELYSLINPTAAVDTIPLADLFGSSSGITEALATGSASGAITDFLTDGWNDLLGYFGVFAN